MTATGAFSVDETHGILWQRTNTVAAASDGLGWRSVYASVQREQPYEGAYAGVLDHLVVLHLSGPVGVSRLLGGARTQRLVDPGGLFILPGGVDFGVRLAGPLDSLHVYVRDDVLRDLAADIFPGDPQRVELIPKLGDRDRLIEQVALSVRAALIDPEPASGVCIDHLARALGARLLTTHARATRPPAAASQRAERLTERQLARAIDCMEANLSDTLALADIARAAGLSEAQLVRRFRASLGTTPHQHLIRLRLKRAMRLLREADSPVARVAFACGFAHQEHMTRTFSRLLGTTPAAFRRMARA